MMGGYSMKIKSAVLSFFILTLCAFSVFAGDVANFVNLGFSDDSGYFMFGFYSIDGDTGKPFAEIYTVDVKTNSFVTGGVAKEVFPENIQPGQDAGGAFYTLLEKNIPLVNKFGIKHLRQGRPLYILLNGDTIKEDLEFRDFNKKNQYSVLLKQTSFGSGPQVRSSFYINLTVRKENGEVRVYDAIGRPMYYREKVMAYRIRQIILSPDEKHLVCVIERDEYSATGKSVRYMVETVQLKY
jgi:predicted secreted protein